MAELSFNFIIYFTIILYFQIETFIVLCYNNIVFFTKNLKIQKTKEIESTSIFTSNNIIFFIFVIISLLFFKGTVINFWFILIIIFTLFLTSIVLSEFVYFSKINLNFFKLLLPFFIGFLMFISKINSFLIFFFYIELYGVLYYFIFLSTYTYTNITLLKYKTSILMLLWNNFLTTFFLAIGCFFILYSYGSLNFKELQIISSNYIGIYLFMIGLFWKLGLPLFHFLKLEIYKFLLKENVFLFTIITTSINMLLIYFSFSQYIIYNIFYTFNLLIILLIFVTNIIIINLKNYNILQYFAISGILTMSTLLILFII